ncbi:DNA repair protein rad14 [Pseudohyphozyma bogoriensis]|nr:DNA repair protein rad14 [Pseudohyphozyma bogoriensis]
MPGTPPPGAAASLPLTPEQVKLIAANRLKAKAKIQERDRLAREAAQRQPSSVLNANHKRPLQTIPFDSTSPTAPNTRTVPTRPSSSTRSASSALQSAVASGSGPSGASTSTATQAKSAAHFKRDDPNVPLKNMIGTYVEYDLATLKNSKGGFLVESEEDDPRRIKERQLIEENQRKRLENQRKQGLFNRQPGISADPRDNPKCKHCGSSAVDEKFQQIFGVLVCSSCKTERPEEYSLLTKTECKEDYLLTDPELKDEELLPHLLRPNPHRPTYSNMMLFLRLQVEAFAFSPAKWGSPEALDAEFERREAEKKEKKSKKFDKKLKELRKKTKTNVWHRRVEAEHKHVFPKEGDGEDGVQRCEECGFEVECEVF